MALILPLLIGCTLDANLNPFGDAVSPGGPPIGEAPLPPPIIRPLGAESRPAFEENGEPGDVLFTPGVVHDLEILLSDEAWRDLRDDPDEDVPGILKWHGVEYAAGVKVKGSSSYRSIREKASFKVDVHQYDRERRVNGLKRLTLNNMIQDPTMLREHAYYWLADMLAVPAPRHGYARLKVNGEPYGLYTLVETMDGRLMKRLYPDDKDGNLYEASGADFTDARNWFDVQVDGGIVPVEDDIDDLVEALEDAGKHEFGEVFAARFDTDAVLRYLALDIVTGNDDGYVFNHHNYHAYHLAFADRWVLLPWGTDRSFTREVSPRGGGLTPILGVLATRCWDDDDCADGLRDAIGDVLHVWEDGGFLEELEATAERIEAHCEDDPKREKDCDADDILEFVEARAEQVRDGLD